ncbi:hypothetical protein B0T25DRAFT_521465 [Lasiosphaeria hispida]|uniref:Uncharacterized protein n=1 Tax=Lasiosphaeria hispida TaxID=260671 RepID=A0AAJ0MBT0_9PEZI|nr:hypothetical protein B0T25DRAFT_521465 [Lasiosphaeria hispida]
MPPVPLPLFGSAKVNEGLEALWIPDGVHVSSPLLSSELPSSRLYLTGGIPQQRVTGGMGRAPRPSLSDIMLPLRRTAPYNSTTDTSAIRKMPTSRALVERNNATAAAVKHQPASPLPSEFVLSCRQVAPIPTACCLLCVADEEVSTSEKNPELAGFTSDDHYTSAQALGTTHGKQPSLDPALARDGPPFTESNHTDNSSTDGLLQYERYLEQETEQHVRARMRTNPIPCVRNLTESVRHELLQQMPQLVRDIQLDLFRSYKTSHRSNSPGLTSSAPRPAPAAQTDGEPTQPLPAQQDILQDPTHIGDATPQFEPSCLATCLETLHCRHIDARLGSAASEWMDGSLFHGLDFAETVAESSFADMAGFEFASLLSGHREVGRVAGVGFQGDGGWGEA